MSRIVLKSFHCLEYYPNNKPNDFTIKIPNLSSMGHNLKVAIVDITFPLAFKNVRNGYNQIDVIPVMDKSEKSAVDKTIKDLPITALVDEGGNPIVKRIMEDPQNEFSTVKGGPRLAAIYGTDDILSLDEIMNNPRIKFKIDPDFYKPTSLIDEINAKIDKGTMEIELNENNKGWISMNRKFRVKFGLDIAKILGFNSGEWLTFGPQKTISQNQAGSYKNMSLLNVYCDIVEESLIGEDHYQLLKIVNWNAAKLNDETSPSISYSYPYFIPVKHTHANTINIKITDSLDIPVEFIGDEPVVVILEFRNE